MVWGHMVNQAEEVLTAVRNLAVALPDEVGGSPIVITLSVRLSVRPSSFRVRSITPKPLEIFS